MKIINSVNNGSKGTQGIKSSSILPKPVKVGKGQKLTAEESEELMDKNSRNLNSGFKLPDGVIEVSTDEYTLNLSDKQLKIATDNADRFISYLDSSKVIGDDVKVAYYLKYDSKFFQNPKAPRVDDYFIRSLIKFLDPNFKVTSLQYR